MSNSDRILHIEDDNEFSLMFSVFFSKFYPGNYSLDLCKKLDDLDQFEDEYDIVITDLWLEDRDWIKTVSIVNNKFSCPIVILSNLGKNISKALFEGHSVYFFYSKDELRKSFPEKIYNILRLREKSDA